MKILNSLLLVACLSATLALKAQTRELTQYVNPLVGSDSDYPLSNGNTYPAIALPWGMNFWSPQTGNNSNGWAYTYHAYKIRGFKETHQPSPWINDYGAFSLMPQTGMLKFLEGNRGSWFSHKTETAKPHYYKVYLADYDITVEITPTERAAQFRFTYPKSDESSVILDAFNMGSYVKIIPEKRKIMGYCKNNHGGVPENFKNYFVAYFDKDSEAIYTFKDSLLQKYSKEAQSGHVGAIVRFKTKQGEVVNVKVASSFISYEQADLNLKRELGDDTFDQTLAKAKGTWNKELNKISVEG